MNATHDVTLVIAGILAAGYAIAALYFFKFWRRTGDRLFAFFAVAFALLVALNSTGWIGQPAQAVAGDVSRWCLVASIAGIG